jgi:hypothetical protein
MQALHQVTVHRPVDQVFDFLADGSNNPRWQPRVTWVSQVGAALDTGTEFKQSMRHPFGFVVTADYRLTGFERPTRLSLVGTSGGPIHPTVNYELSGIEEATTILRCTVEYELAGISRVAAPLLALLHPLFSWEASWIDQAKTALEEP